MAGSRRVAIRRVAAAAVELSGRAERGSGARTVARKLALQALYRWQLNVCPWQDLVQEFADDPDMPRADNEYFRTLIQGICDERDALDGALAPLLDRKPAELAKIAIDELRFRDDHDCCGPRS